MTKFEEFKLDEIGVAQLTKLSKFLIPVPKDTVGQRIKRTLSDSSQLRRKFKAKQDSVSMQAHYEQIWSSKSLQKEFSGGIPVSKISESRRITYDGRHFYSPDRWLTATMIVCLASHIRQLSPKIVIEVGSGSGMLMIALASIFPKQQFIGLELTESGIASAITAMQNKTLVTNICSYVFGQEVLPNIVFPISNLSFNQVDMSKPLSALTADFVFTSLAFEQMESVFDEAFENAISLVNKEAMFFEPFLEFNSSRQKHVLISKKYLYRTVPFQKVADQASIDLLSMPKNTNKTKYAFGIVRIKKS